MNHSVGCSTVQELAILGIQRRSELPQRRSLAAAAITSGKGDAVPFIDCPGFMRRGACPEFNQRRRCSHHHPFDAHIVETPKPRCPQVRLNLSVSTFVRLERALRCTCQTYAGIVHRESPRGHTGDNNVEGVRTLIRAPSVPQKAPRRLRARS